jgi:Tfp pilus assembly protein PilW
VVKDRRSNAAAGLTLVEMLVGIAIAMLACAALATLARSTLTAWRNAGAHAEAVGEALAALDHLTRDLRGGGYDPLAHGGVGLTAIAADEVTITADLDGDGSVDETSAEHVTYRRAESSDDLLRVVGRQAMPILGGLAPGGLRLQYHDAEGHALDPAGAGSAAAARTVAIELATRATVSRPAVQVVGGARLLNR